MKEISRTYKITGLDRAQSYYIFTYPDGRKVQIPNFPDIRNIKFTKHIAPGESYDISLFDSNS